MKGCSIFSHSARLLIAGYHQGLHHHTYRLLFPPYDEARGVGPTVLPCFF